MILDGLLEEDLDIGATKVLNHGWAILAKLPKLKYLITFNMPVTCNGLRETSPLGDELQRAIRVCLAAQPRVLCQRQGTR